MVHRLDGPALPLGLLDSISGASGCIYRHQDDIGLGCRVTYQQYLRERSVWLETSTRKVFRESLPPVGWLKEKGRLVHEATGSQLVL